MSEQSQITQQTPRQLRDEDFYVPQSEFGKRLWEIRQRIVRTRDHLLTLEEIEREVAARRGERRSTSQ